MNVTADEKSKIGILSQMDEFTECCSLIHPGINEDMTCSDFISIKNLKKTLVLVLYTGGTIGMSKIDNSYKPVPNYFAKVVRRLPMLHDTNFIINKKSISGKNIDSEENDSSSTHHPFCVMPALANQNRIFYAICEYSQLLDSSNCTFDNWVQIAQDVESYYDKFDGFVILHGTDTMAYASSALSFIFQNLSKPIIITGSQIPLFEIRSDGRDNFIGALLLAGGGYNIPEVAVFFHNKLYRGCRVVKKSSTNFDAFDSPNFPPIAELSIDIQIHNSRIFIQNSKKSMSVQGKLCRQVAILRLFPSITTESIRNFLHSSLKGIVLQSYGAGNVPAARKDLIALFKDATYRGIVIVNTTQCYNGGVNAIYETGAALHECGVVPAFDMTPEAALTKLAYLLAKYQKPEVCREKFLQNLRGEVTIPESIEVSLDENEESEYSLICQSSIEDEVIYRSVDANLLNIAIKYFGDVFSSLSSYNEWSKGIIPMLLCEVARRNDVESLKLLQYHTYKFQCCDYNGQSPLHLAARYCSEACVEFLAIAGADIYATDYKNMTPLVLAFREAPYVTFKILRSLGGFYPMKQEDSFSTCDQAPWTEDEKRNLVYHNASIGNVNNLRMLFNTGASLQEFDHEGRTPLHLAVINGQFEVARFLLMPRSKNIENFLLSTDKYHSQEFIENDDFGAGVDPLSKSSDGLDALQLAHKYNNQSIIDLIKSFL